MIGGIIIHKKLWANVRSLIFYYAGGKGFDKNKKAPLSQGAKFL